MMQKLRMCFIERKTSNYPGELATESSEASILDNPLPAACTDLIGQWIPVGSSLSCSYVVTHTDPGSYDNTASVTVVDDDGSTASDSDSETVTVNDVPSAIDLTKSASPSSVPETGGNVTFTFKIDNLSAVDTVTVNSLTDTVFGDLNALSCSMP